MDINYLDNSKLNYQIYNLINVKNTYSIISWRGSDIHTTNGKMIITYAFCFTMGSMYQADCFKYIFRVHLCSVLIYGNHNIRVRTTNFLIFIGGFYKITAQIEFEFNTFRHYWSWPFDNLETRVEQCDKIFGHKNYYIFVMYCFSRLLYYHLNLFFVIFMLFMLVIASL